jgi:hypothetical protein
VSHLSTLGSAAVGALVALAGIYAGPRMPRRTNLDWALAAAAASAAGAAVWGFRQHQLPATILPFLLVSFVAGEWRARGARRRGGQPSSSSSPSPSRGSRR